MDNSEKKKEFKKRIYKLMLEVVSFCDHLPKDSITQKIADQLIRSGTSIGANYFEAFSASSKKDYVNYYHIALKSTNESIFWVCLLKDSGKSNTKSSDILINELKQIAKIFASSILTMKGKKSI